MGKVSEQEIEFLVKETKSVLRDLTINFSAWLDEGFSQKIGPNYWNNVKQSLGRTEDEKRNLSSWSKLSDLDLFGLLKLRLVALEKNETYLVNEIDDGLNKLKIKDLEYVEDYLNAIELRYKQLIERLFDEWRGYDIEDKSDKILHKLVTDRTVFEKQDIREIFSIQK